MLKMTYSPSKLQDEKECYYSGSLINLDRHHIFNGNHSFRKKCDEDGFWVWLSRPVHTYIHTTVEGRELLIDLKMKAQEIYEQEHTREEFIKRYGKSYL